jgi:hypothetical protein
VAVRTAARTATRTAGVTLVVALLVACGASPRRDVVPGTVTDLASARAAWAAAGLKDYDLVVGIGCFCPPTPPLHITVRAGVGVSTAVETPAGSPARPPTPSPDDGGLARSQVPTSVDALFEVIEARQSDSDSVKVTYDGATGVPLRIDVDQMEQATDDEVAYVISFRPLGGTAVPGPTG